MVHERRRTRALGSLALVAVLAVADLAGCGTGPAPAPAETGPTQTAPSQSGPTSVTASQPVAGASGGPTNAAFTVAEGAERDACGVGLTVKIIPPSATGNPSGQAFVVAGPIGQVRDPSGDEPPPGNVAPARAGAIITVMGKRFKVDGVDISRGRVTLTALC